MNSRDRVTLPLYSTHQPPTQIRPTQRWLRITYITWMMIAVSALITFALGLPSAYAKALHLSASSISALTSLGLPLNLPAIILVGTDIFTIVSFGGVAAFIVWLRSDDFMALTAAMLMFTLGIVYSSPLSDAPLPIWWIAFFVAFGEFTQVMFVFLFPTGRFVPRAMAYLALPILNWRLVMWTVWYLPGYLAFPITAETYGHTEQFAWDVIPFLVLLVLGIGFQVYRYRHQSSPTEKQQAKILLYGMAITIVVVGLWVLIFNVFPIFPAGSRNIFLSVGSRVVRQIALLIVPIALAVAMLRYRLWNIDFVINRSLVYGLLTLTLSASFFISILIFQLGLRLVTGGQQSTIALGGSAILIGLAFTPVRNTLRRFVDRNFYNIQIDYQSKKRAAPVARILLSDNPIIGKTVSMYKLVEPIGRGGMAEVYRGEHLSLNQQAAIKVLPADLSTSKDYLRRFEREARTIATLQHRNIVQLYDFGHLDGIPYMVMELLSGQSLSEIILARAPLDLKETCLLLKDIASALDYAHMQGVIHRDVKPANVMIQPISSTSAARHERAVLMDFGIAKLVHATTKLTKTGVMGTLDYIAPEQISSAPTLDRRADIYSLGVMTFEMLTGKLPFPNSSVAALLIAHLQQPAPDIRTLRSDLPVVTAAAIQRALEKDPTRRFNTAGDFVHSLC